jgi:hypothetical protein
MERQEPSREVSMQKTSRRVINVALVALLVALVISVWNELDAEVQKQITTSVTETWRRVVLRVAQFVNSLF